MSRRSSLLAVAAFAVLLLPHPLAAARSSDAAMIEEVVVTAARRETALSEITNAVSVTDADAIARGLVLTDALADTPGAHLQQTTPGQGAVIIRGQRGSSVLHLVDGMRLNNAIFRSAPTQYLALVPVSAVDRIETIRGTPASLYGSDAVGGAIQVVTRMPRVPGQGVDTLGGEVFAGWSSAEQGHRGRVVVDAGKGPLAGTLALEYLETGDRRVGGGERIRPSGYESRAARAALVYSPDPETRVSLDLHYLEQPSTPRVDELVAGFGQTAPSSAEFRFEPNRRLFAHSRFERDGGLWDLDWRASLSWQRIDDDRRTRDLDAPSRILERNRSDLFGLMVTASKEHDRLRWLAGLEAYRDEVSSSRTEQDIASGSLAPSTPRFPDGARLDQAAAFLNMDVDLTFRQSLTAGVRANAVRVDLPATPASEATSFDIGDLSGDLGWRFDVNRDWQIVANLGYGFRAPNIFDLGTLGARPGNRFNVPNTDLDSERVVHLDAGVRHEHEDWRLELTVFALEYSDRIVSVSTGAQTPEGRDVVQSINAAESRVHGVEVGARRLLGDSFELEAYVDYTHGEQEIEGITEPADRIPPLGGRVLLSFRDGGPLSASAWVRFARRQDRLSARDKRDVRIDPNGTDGYAIAGVRAEWQTPKGWTLALGVDNLLDQRYRRHGSGIDAPGIDVEVSLSRRW